jgi:hypothetical protein
MGRLLRGVTVAVGGRETADGEQSPVLNVFTRDGGGFRHRRATELMFAPRDEGEEPRHADSIWPIWNVLDLTPRARERPGLPRDALPVAAHEQATGRRQPRSRHLAWRPGITEGAMAMLGM